MKNSFLDKTEPCPESGCWLWLGGHSFDGYGKVYWQGKTGGIAQRISYSLFIAPVPKNICVLHKCDVRSCVNPQHLFLGTCQDNADDRNRKGRSRGPIGSRNGRSKLSPTKIQEIKDLRNAGETLSKIGSYYGVTPSTIRRVCLGLSWNND